MVRLDAFPPNFAVMTAAAVAVGHIRQVMAASSVTLLVDDGKYNRSNAKARHVVTWNMMSKICQRHGRSSRGETLQNVRNSMTKMRVGVSRLINPLRKGFSGFKKCIWANIK